METDNAQGEQKNYTLCLCFSGAFFKGSLKRSEKKYVQFSFLSFTLTTPPVVFCANISYIYKKRNC